MNIRRNLSLVLITIGITASAAGCALAPAAPIASTPTMSSSSASATPEATTSPEISAAAEARVPAVESKVVTIAAPPPPALPSPAGQEAATEAVAPVATVPEAVPAAAPPAQAVQAPAAVAPPAAPVSPAVSREVYVGLTGGQSVVDLGRGPVLFPLSDISTPYVAEHDSMGGWARFGTLSAGMTVRMSGLVTGTYTVGQIINVPKGGTTAEFGKFSVMPKVMLQTCVPGTSRMIVVGLY